MSIPTFASVDGAANDLSKDNATDGAVGGGNTPGLEYSREPIRSGTHQSLQDRFIQWLSRQSLPRLLGVFLSNTHDLEARLADKDAEIVRLRVEITWWQDRYAALTDSYLLSRGLRPTEPQPPIQQPQQVVRLTPGDKMAVEIEADKLAEMFLYDPAEMTARVEDLTHSTRPRDREILRRLDQRLAAMPLSDLPTDGVVIGN